MCFIKSLCIVPIKRRTFNVNLLNVNDNNEIYFESHRKARAFPSVLVKSF